MNSEVKITKYSNADDTDLRALEVDIGLKTIKTPVKALITNDFFKDTIFPSEFSSLHESFLRFDEKSLISMDEDKKYSIKKNDDIFKYKVKANNCPAYVLLSLNVVEMEIDIQIYTKLKVCQILHILFQILLQYLLCPKWFVISIRIILNISWII